MKRKILLATVAILVVFSMLLTGCNKKKPGTSSSGSNINVSGDSSDILSGDSSNLSSVVGGENSSKANTGSGSKNTNSGGSTGSKILESSLIKIDDIRSKDKDSGTILIDDDLDNWSKVFARDLSGLIFDSNQASAFEGDNSRVVRSGATANKPWFVYKLDEGISEFALITYWANDDSLKTPLSFYSSPDNSSWTAVSGVSSKDAPFMGGGWVKKIISKKGLPAGTKYLKIEYGNLTKGASYSPNIGRIRINVIDKMDSMDRYLEGRASATFYVDSKSGSDNNDGLSTAKPFKSLFKVSGKFFQPGDKILFKAGSTFNGSLTIKGYGSASDPITVSSYGDGERPIISARGGTAVILKATDIQFTKIAVTNSGGTQGINVLALTTGENKNITISDCKVYNVKGAESLAEASYTYSNGGIVVQADGIDPTWFNGVTIKNNIIEETSRTGICFETMWANRLGTWGYNIYKSDTDGWYPYKNVTVSGNSIKKSGGDGILVIGAVKPLIERNVVYDAFATSKKIAVAALWVVNCNDAIMQYNEVGYTSFKTGQTDGEGYDIDLHSKNTLFQYNYSHHNGGGFILICPIASSPVSAQIVRYNLSVDDAVATFQNQGVFMITGSNFKGTQIYNNTIYIGKVGKDTIYPVDARNFNGGGTPDGYTFTNNIFYVESGVNAAWRMEATNFIFNNNLFVGIGEPSGNGISVSSNKMDNPNFKNKGITTFDNKDAMISAFTPTNNVPGAASISDNGGNDIKGNSVSSPFFGAIKP